MTSLTHEDLGSAPQRERRRRILDATIALASHGGFEAVQMRAVAERADVALGTLYRYFPSKIHLLVSALGREFEEARTGFERRALPGDTAADRVMYVLSRVTRSLQRDPHLTEALTRAFMFADASVSAEIDVVVRHVSQMLLRALHEQGERPGEITPTGQDEAVVKVLGDVWLASLVQWVTGRASADDVTRSLDVAVRLLLRR
ncbi:MAG TPA: TetR family transcriptional regulator [Nocardioidaceae bacterium]|jgi:AcrR family transcriptional regulator